MCLRVTLFLRLLVNRFSFMQFSLPEVPRPHFDFKMYLWLSRGTTQLPLVSYAPPPHVLVGG